LGKGTAEVAHWLPGDSSAKRGDQTRCWESNALLYINFTGCKIRSLAASAINVEAKKWWLILNAARHPMHFCTAG
jgi:hypothetical protein